MGMMIRSERLQDVGLALVVLAVSLALRAGIAPTDLGVEGLDALTVALTVLTALPLVVRRDAPLAVFVVTGLASVALSGVAGSAGPPVGATVALYFAAADAAGSRPRNRLLLAVAAAMLVAHASANGIGGDALPGLLFGTVLWGGAWLAGDRSRLRQERMAALEERARRAELDAERDRRLAAAEERTRIARDLHDSAGHAINVILVHAGLGRMRAESDESRAEFETIEQVARETVGEIDQLVGILREAGGNGAVEPPPGLAALDALVERHRAAGLAVEVTRTGGDAPLPTGADRAAYRILQEALTNAARHGDGEAAVEVRREAGRLELTISNPLPPGAGASDADGGHGIVGMRERATLLGGELETEARDGTFRVRADLPAAEAER